MERMSENRSGLFMHRRSRRASMSQYFDNLMSVLSIPSCHTDHRIRSRTIWGGNCRTTTIAGNYVTGVPLAGTFTLRYSTIEPNTTIRITFARI